MRRTVDICLFTDTPQLLRYKQITINPSTMNQHHYEVVERSIPKPLLYIGGGILYLYALLVTFWVIKLAIVIFEANWKAGLALFLTGIGEAILFLPLVVAWGGPSWLVEKTENIQNSWEFWMKLVFGFIGIILLAWILYILIGLAIAALLL